MRIFPPDLGGIGLLAVILAILPKTVKIATRGKSIRFHSKIFKNFRKFQFWNFLDGKISKLKFPKIFENFKS